MEEMWTALEAGDRKAMLACESVGGIEGKRRDR
jgi:hypothetical protein